MLIFHDLSRKSEYPTVAALGFFDGVHLGHRAVIAEAVKQARAQNGKGAVFTFEPPHHTDRAVSKSDVKLLQSPESRDRVMEEKTKNFVRKIFFEKKLRHSLQRKSIRGLSIHRTIS